MPAINSLGTLSARSYGFAARKYGPPAWTTFAAMNGSTARANMTDAGWGPVYGFTAVGVNNFAYAVGAGSSNGIAWNTPALMNGHSVISVPDTVAADYSSGAIMMVGRNNSGFPLSAYSLDGSVTWTTPTAFAAVRYWSRSLIRTGSGGFVFMATNGSNVGYVFRNTSVSGAWSAPYLMNGYASQCNIEGMAMDSSGRIVGVGYASNRPVSTISTDGGLTWTTPAIMNNVAATWYMQSVAVSETGRWVAVGYNGVTSVSAYSDNGGVNWTSPTVIPGLQYALGVAYSSGKFVVSGNVSSYAVSADGVNWSAAAYVNTSSTNITCSKVVANDTGRFLLVGPHPTTGVPMYSTIQY